MPETRKAVDNTNKNSDLNKGNFISVRSFIQFGTKGVSGKKRPIYPSQPSKGDKGYNNPIHDPAFDR